MHTATVPTTLPTSISPPRPSRSILTRTSRRGPSAAVGDQRAVSTSYTVRGTAQPPGADATATPSPACGRSRARTASTLLRWRS